jgi:hypothetical protein
MRTAAREQGCLLRRGLLDRPTVIAVRACVLSLLEELGWLDPSQPPLLARPRQGFRLEGASDPHYVAFLQRLLPDSRVAALGTHPALAEALACLGMRHPQHIPADVCRAVSPLDDPTPPHQDSHYLPAYDALWVAWIPLGDCPRVMGPLAVRPGSHRAGLVPHRPDADGRQVAVAVPPDGWASADLACGDVVFFHGHTLHRALPNRSSSFRLSMDFRVTSSPGRGDVPPAAPAADR